MTDSDAIWRRVKADVESLHAPFGAGLIDTLPTQQQNLMRLVAVRSYAMALEDNANAVETAVAGG